MNNTDPCCGNCRYFRVETWAETTVSFCRRYPASIEKDMNDWCGEYDITVEALRAEFSVNNPFEVKQDISL